MKDLFGENIHSILKDKNVEGIPLKNINTLRDILNDKTLMNKFWKQFENNFTANCDTDDFYMKTEDFIYRINLLVNDYIIPTYGDISNKAIKEKIEDMVNNNIDLYSAVSYDDTDILIIEDFYDIDNGKEIGI